jgi:hypothetical protein
MIYKLFINDNSSTRKTPTISRKDWLSIGHFNIHSTSDLWCQEVKLPVLRWLSSVLCVHLRRHACLIARCRTQGQPRPTHQQLVDKTHLNTWGINSKWFFVRIQDSWGVTACLWGVSTDRCGFFFAKTNLPSSSEMSLTNTTRLDTPDVSQPVI